MSSLFKCFIITDRYEFDFLLYGDDVLFQEQKMEIFLYFLCNSIAFYHCLFITRKNTEYLPRELSIDLNNNINNYFEYTTNTLKSDGLNYIQKFKVQKA